MADHLTEESRKTLNELKKSATEKQLRLLDQLDTQLGAMVPAEGGGVMRVESMVASKTGNPEVTFTWGRNKGQLGVVQARGYAYQIIESCEAAVQDACLFRAALDMNKGKPEEGEKMGWALITMVRNNRAKFEE